MQTLRHLLCAPVRAPSWVIALLAMACGSASSEDVFDDSAPGTDAGAGGIGAQGQGGAASIVDPPVATDPCGDDLNVHNGAVVLDLGAVPDGGVFVGDPAANGSDSFTTQPITVVLTAESFQGAGMTIDLTAGQISGTAWLPSSEAPHELVMMLPGFSTSYATYTPYAEHLASHGFIVVGIDTRSNPLAASHDTEALEVVRAIDWALGGSPFKDSIDATKIAVAGHSKGGKVSFFAAALDPRIDLVIGWDPVNAGGGPCAFDPNCNAMPVAPNCTVQDPGIEYFMHAESLVIGAPPDPTWNPEPAHNAVHFYRGAPSPAGLVLLNTGHVAWASGAGEPDVFRITKAAHLSRLMQRFRGETGVDMYLPASTTLGADPKVLQLAAK
jgi:hypothetical protein